MMRMLDADAVAEFLAAEDAAPPAADSPQGCSRRGFLKS